MTAKSSRRGILKGAAAFSTAACFPQLVRAQADAELSFPRPKHPGRLIEVRGKRLYVDVSGAETAPPLVYIHGGPGAGSYDFGLYQRELLSRHFRLVQFDQRGALRSEPVAADEAFSLSDLIEDTEALRVALGISRWSVACHSFGGLVALPYALAYPSAIDRVVFENPSFDIGASDRSMLFLFARALREAGMVERADEALAAALKPATARESWADFGRFGSALGTRRRLDLYAPGLPPGYFFEWMRNSDLPESNWLRGSGPSQATLWRDDRVFENMQPRLADLKAPALLIKGRHDHNTSPDQIESFARLVSNGRLVVLEGSGHMTRAEEPQRYADEVTRFLSA